MNKAAFIIGVWLTTFCTASGASYSFGMDAEPNDALADAIPAAMYENYPGHFFGEGLQGQDTYRFTVTEQGRVVIALAGLPASCNVHLVLNRIRAGERVPVTITGQLVHSSLQDISEGVFDTGTCSYREYFSPSCPDDVEGIVVETTDEFRAGDVLYVTVRWLQGGSTTQNVPGGSVTGAVCYRGGPYYLKDIHNASVGDWSQGALREPLAYVVRAEMADGAGTCRSWGEILPPLEFSLESAPVCDSFLVGTCSAVEVLQRFRARPGDVGKNVRLYWVLMLQPPWGDALFYSFTQAGPLEEGIVPFGDVTLASDLLDADLVPLDLRGLKGWTVHTYFGYTSLQGDDLQYACWNMTLD